MLTGMLFALRKNYDLKQGAAMAPCFIDGNESALDYF
jgi:hypothetical protein